jgi:hypothetical protein
MKKELLALKKLEASSYNKPKLAEKPEWQGPPPIVLDREHYSVRWVANYLGITTRSVLRRIEEGKLANCLDISGSKSKRSTWRIPRQSLIAYKINNAMP